MKRALATLNLVGFSLTALAASAYAAPGEATDASMVEILNLPLEKCTAPGGFCVAPGASTTVAARPAHEVAAAEHQAPEAAPAASTTSAAHPAHEPAAAEHMAPEAAPGFARAPITSEHPEGAGSFDERPWTLAINASLHARALAGNAVFLVFDAEDPKAVVDREVLRIWQAPIPAGESLGARVILSPDDNFHANHSYLIRVLQLVRGQEVILTEGQVRLM